MNDIDKMLCRLLYILVVGLILFAMADALGKVEEATSYGLHEILNIIGMLSTGIVGILAGRRRPLKQDETEETKSLSPESQQKP